MNIMMALMMMMLTAIDDCCHVYFDYGNVDGNVVGNAGY